MGCLVKTVKEAVRRHPINVVVVAGNDSSAVASKNLMIDELKAALLGLGLKLHPL